MTVPQQLKSKPSEFFGQFAEKSFYEELLKTIVTEVLRAAVLALTGSITFYITNKISGRALPPAPASSNNDLANRAFGSEPYGRDYNRGSSYVPSTVSHQSSSFPGFGNR